MTGSHSVPTSGAALQLLLTAERLFARDGLAGVPLRQIAIEAGSSNNSAVHYHFGSKERLVEAIFAHRLPGLLQRRELLLARARPDDLRARLEAQLMPMLEMAEWKDSWYLSFLEQLQRTPSFHPLLWPLQSERSHADFIADLQALIPDVEEPVRTTRIQQLQLVSLHTAAERERAAAAGTEVAPFALFVSTLLDACIGYLTAAVSDETKRFLARPDAVRLDRVVRLV